MTQSNRIDVAGTGVEFSRLVFGAWRLLDSAPRPDPAAIGRLIGQSVEIGLTTFDHADIYGVYAVEEAFGEGLRAWGGPRRSIELVTKCDIMMKVPERPHHRVKFYDTSAQHIVASVERSLKLLGTDYLDVLLIHRPDPLMDADETAHALDGVIKSGKVRAVGVSNFTPSQFDLLQSRLSAKLITNQIEHSVLHTPPLTDGSLDHAQRLRYAPMIWSPLGGGSLFTGTGEREARVRAALQTVAAEVGAPDISAVAIAWLLRHPARLIPVLGSMKPERLKAMASALDIKLDRQQWFLILEASEGRKVP